MFDQETRNFVEQIHASGRRFVLSLTGGGSGAIAALLQVPGASASVLEVLVPYSAKAFDDWIGATVDQYCSEKTARAMAVRAFGRARELTDDDPRSLVGMGATASLATNRPKRGAHRIHVAWQSAAMTSVTTGNFPSSDATREEEEQIATQIILHGLGESCGLRAPESIATSPAVEVTARRQAAADSWTELFLGNRTSVLVGTHANQQPPAVLLPGAFNPLHWGHERMAEIASRRSGRPVTFELSITNVDKRPLDFIEIADRLRQLAGRPVLLSRAPTFVEKSRLAPGCLFVVGADTIVRIADPIYYHGDLVQRDAAIAAIADRGCRFLVFARTIDGQFNSLSAVSIPPLLREICDEVPESDFMADISSTDLRSKDSKDRSHN